MATIHTKRLILKTLDVNHAPWVLSYLERNRRFFGPTSPMATKEYFTLDFQQRVLESETLELLNRRKIRFYLFEKQDDLEARIIGDICFSNIIYGVLQSAFLGYKLDESFIGKGLMPEAVAHGIQYVFDEFGLHRVEANIMPTNLASVRVVEKLGFNRDGLSKSYLRINGKWEDHLRFSLIKTKG